MSDGSCSDTDLAGCADLGGVYNLGETCDTFTCSQPAACCFDDLTCSEMAQPFCENAGGAYHEGEACEGFRCPRGACCVNDATCEVLTPHACDASDGDYLGDDVSCRNACPCARVKELKASCTGDGTVRIAVKFKNEGSHGELITVAVGERLQAEIRVRGRLARHDLCCLTGDHLVRLIDPEGCEIETVVSCP